jgi:hypothetical protein
LAMNNSVTLLHDPVGIFNHFAAPETVAFHRQSPPCQITTGMPFRRYSLRDRKVSKHLRRTPA